MADQSFHTVEPESLQKLTLSEIVTGKEFPSESLDYLVPVPTSNQSIPQRTKDSWMIIQMGSIDSTVEDSPGEEYRGRLGGC